jgi:hypothetical protein
MKLPNWFKIVWWVVLCVALVILLWNRFGAISQGTGTLLDAFFFLILVALLLLPLFREFEFFGIKLKAQLDNFKSEVKDEISGMRNEIRTSIGINSQVSPQIYLTPPPDNQLPQLEERFRRILDDTMKTYGLQSAVDSKTQLATPDTVSYLFQVRYNLEKELRRIYRERIEPHEQIRGGLSVFRILQSLSEIGLIEPRLYHVVREVYAICSPAIHGEGVTQQKLDFVKDIAPNLITSLMAIK